MARSGHRPAVDITEVDGADADEVAVFYHRVLAPNFAPAELESEASFALGVAAGGTRVLAARSAGEIVGGAVGDWFPKSRVQLLSYLAVAAEGRGLGVGGLLMAALTERWTSELDPALLVMEVEDPRYHHSDANFGDPVARVRFYERLGARTLPVPYFQPALGSGPGARRVPHLMLMVFGGSQAPPAAPRVDGGTVETFLTEYLEGCEGPVGADDADAQRLLAACRRPGGLPLLRVSELLWPATGTWSAARS